MDWLLKLIDCLMRLTPPEKHQPPPPTFPEPPSGLSDEAKRANLSASKDRLKDFYKEVAADQRALRDTEFKNATLFFQTCAFLVAGNLTLAAASGALATLGMKRLIFAISLLFILVFWLQLHARILHDHKSYSFLSAHRRSLETEWFGAEFCKKPDHLGQKDAGPGYRKTQALVAITAMAVLTILAVLLAHAIPQFICCSLS